MPKLLSQAREKYFIGSNTSAGFINYTDEIISGIKKVFIIKGGPGTGKSTLMKRIAEKYHKDGYIPELYYCSSDSSSLDAVVFRGLSFAIVDGTSPHILNAKFPGAVEEIINLGEFLDCEKLSEGSGEIIDLVQRKKELYDSVYRYLSVCREIQNEKNKILKKCVDFEKMKAAISRLRKRLTEEGNSQVLNRQITSLGMNGITKFDTYGALCSEAWLVKDQKGISGIFFDALLSELKLGSYEIWTSKTPLLEIEALYFTGSKVAIVKDIESRENCKIINTERFIIKSEYSSKRAGIRFLSALQKELFERINELFSEIKEIHFSLEEIYGKAIDFTSFDDIFEKVCKKTSK